ncbi:MAG: dynamin family protein [Gammaproteobacteria bacterium]|nr:dynamin family protein [Gammaproteobacteria bacterium]
MAERIEQDFQGYTEWRESLRAAILDFQEWLRRNDVSEPQTDRRLEDVLGHLSDDRLYIAFVAEYSRGKSELINAIFFSGTGQRVLPSRAGRTTMCPTEILHDPEEDPGIRLLPIETRKTGTSIAEYKGYDDEWTFVPLDPANPDQVADALGAVAQVKHVAPAEAQSMGLHIAAEQDDDGLQLNEDGEVDIPRWRHAIINFPHPLLEQGLVILDTPGLNALGAEPELTLNMLSAAHAVLFVLACDTGVTKTDMSVWKNHIRSSGNQANSGLLVVLNKIDTLWDELRDADEVDREIQRQIDDTARVLDVSPDRIFPVSAQKGLFGKVRRDERVLKQSRIGELEAALSDTLIPAKHDIVRENVQQELSDIERNMRMVIAQRINGVQDHVSELENLNSKNVNVIGDMMAKVKEDKDRLEKSLRRFHATRSVFAQQTNLLYTHLNLRNLDSLIAETKKDMAISLTTSGLRSGMDRFFDRGRKAMGEVSSQAREIKELMDGVYRKFQEEHGLAKIKPGTFSTRKYLRELDRVQKRHQEALSGMSLMRTEQGTVIRRFIDSSVAAVRKIFSAANRDADNWLKTIMAPMESQVREHQVQLRRRLESIKRIHKATDSLDERMSELTAVEDGFRDQSRKIDALIMEIDSRLQDSTASGRVEDEDNDISKFDVVELDRNQA